jgi:hypothetical protein
MQWVKPSHSRKDVDAAGLTLLNADKRDSIDVDAAIDVISNWRAAHGFPLNAIQMLLRKKVSSIQQDGYIVAQRLKRLPTMVDKLRRMPKLTLSRFQDIGGCRAVLTSVSNVQRLRADFERSRMKHELVREKDYISSPKASGYRGIHRIYKYSSLENSAYNGLQIEVQIRTDIQHAWATAVETVGTLIGQSLKSSEGQQEWLRFFALASSAFARMEGTNAVPGTPDNPRELNDEIAALYQSLQVSQKLHAYSKALQFSESTNTDADLYLLFLDPTERMLSVRGFMRKKLQEAADEYAKAEQAARDKPGAQAVLVSADSMRSLRRAYPNYFLDTYTFLNKLNQYMTEKDKNSKALSAQTSLDSSAMQK